jgi:superfamily II DNA or RNA helicase
MAKMITNVTELDLRNKFIFNLIVNDIYPIIPILKDRIRIPRINKTNVLKTNLYNNIIELSEEPIIKFRKLLFLSNRIDHLKRIESMLIKYDNRWNNLIGYYIGGMKEKKLKESEKKPLILATFEMASEGLDIPDLDTLILATPKSSITQSIGRILRLQAHQRNYIPTVYDIVDNVSMFIAQGKKRYTDYMSKKYTIDWFNVIDTNINQSKEPFLALPINNNLDQFIDDEFISE